LILKSIAGAGSFQGSFFGKPLSTKQHEVKDQEARMAVFDAVRVTSLDVGFDTVFSAVSLVEFVRKNSSPQRRRRGRAEALFSYRLIQPGANEVEMNQLQ